MIASRTPHLLATANVDFLAQVQSDETLRRILVDADLIVCRAGASTVTEIAAVGAAALFVPFPAAVDDHQTVNARFLTDAGAGWLLPQSDLTPQGLADFIARTDRRELLARAQKAKALEKTNATREVVMACEALAGGNNT